MISFKLLLNHAKGGGDVAVGGVGFMAVSITRMGLVGGVEGVEEANLSEGGEGEGDRTSK